jgi:hypothetical protein
MVKNETCGFVSSFKRKTGVLKLAEEIGPRQIDHLVALLEHFYETFPSRRTRRLGHPA